MMEMAIEIELGPDRMQSLKRLTTLITELNQVAESKPCISEDNFIKLVKVVSTWILGSSTDKIANCLNAYMALKGSSGSKVNLYSKLILRSLAEVIIGLNIDLELGKIDILNKFHRVMTQYTHEMRKSEICEVLHSQFEDIIEGDADRMREFSVCFTWL
jgi:hypothetical protein